MLSFYLLSLLFVLFYFMPMVVVYSVMLPEWYENNRVPLPIIIFMAQCPLLNIFYATLFISGKNW